MSSLFSSKVPTKRGVAGSCTTLLCVSVFFVTAWGLLLPLLLKAPFGRARLREAAHKDHVS